VAGGLTTGRDPQGRYATTTASAEIYDPATGEWELTAPMLEPRHGHQAVLLATGEVLVVGGWSPDESWFAEVYHPGTRTWRPLRFGAWRSGFGLTVLNDGRVLLAGGLMWDGFEVSPTGMIYDPWSGEIRKAASMSQARIEHSIATLASGRVMVFGGACDPDWQAPLSSVEMYDPSSDKWSAGPRLDFGYGRAGWAPLRGGRLMVAGPYFPSGSFTEQCGAAGSVAPGSYDPSVNRFFDEERGWLAAPVRLRNTFSHSAHALDERHVVVIGTDLSPRRGLVTEVFDAQEERWLRADDLPPRGWAYVTAAIPGGQALIVGGNECHETPGAALLTCEFFPLAHVLKRR
jgi:hypothetical protein